MTTYTPAPGTVAFRVIGWLEEQGATKEFNASQIANALDLDPKTITTCLQNALDTGLVFRRQKDRTHQRAPVWWSLTNHGLRQRMEMSPNPVGWMTRPPKDDDEVPTFRGRATDTPKGDQPRSERGRGVMEPAVCESADGRGTTGAPALATLSHTASPGVGPMGAGQPADAGPTTDQRSGGQGTRPCADEQSEGHGRHAPVAAPGWRESSPLHHDEQRREVDAQFAASLRAAMGQGDQLQPADLAATRRAAHAPHEPAPLAFRAARFSDGTLATERDGIVVAVYSAAEVDAIQKLLGART